MSREKGRGRYPSMISISCQKKNMHIKICATLAQKSEKG